jgi:uncharacterized protein (DUF2236 family)
MAPSDWTDDFLDAMQRRGDPPADAAVAAIFRDGNVAAVNRLLGQLLAGTLPAAEAPAALSAFLRDTAALPAWADSNRIGRAEQLTLDYGVLCAGALYTSGLPTCYSSRGIAAVLATTLRLEREELIWRRLIETGQFVFNVSDAGGLSGGHGVRTIQQVRLMHAAVRHLILTRPGGRASSADAPALGRSLLAMEWDDTLGHPVNQVELAWTLLTFSLSVLRALEQLGGVLTIDQKNAYIHFWSVVGHVLGIDDRLLCRSVDEAVALFDRLSPRLTADTPSGRALVQALVDFAHPALPRALTRALIRYHVGDERAALLGARASGAGLLLQTISVTTLRFIVEKMTFLYRSSPVIRWLGDRATRRLLGRIVSLSRAYGRAPFQLPTHLAGLVRH